MRLVIDQLEFKEEAVLRNSWCISRYTGVTFPERVIHVGNLYFMPSFTNVVRITKIQISGNFVIIKVLEEGRAKALFISAQDVLTLKGVYLETEE